MEFGLHYTEQGEGTPFLLLHGNGGRFAYFMHQITHFSNQYRVIAVDTRGHGESPRGDAPFSLTQFAEDLKCLLDTLKLKKVILLGFSDGGNIAMLFTLRYPEYVSCLILNGANFYPNGLKPTVRIPMLLGYIKTSCCSTISRRAKAKKELLGLMVKEPYISPEELHKIQVPTLVIAGDKDMIKQTHTEQLAAHIPNSRLVIMKGDHFIARKEPSVFNCEVEKFLDEMYHGSNNVAY